MLTIGIDTLSIEELNRMIVVNGARVCIKSKKGVWQSLCFVRQEFDRRIIFFEPMPNSAHGYSLDFRRSLFLF